MSAVGVRGLGGAQVQQLAAEVPVVERLAGLEALVALQPVDRPAGDLAPARAPARSCPTPGLALQEQRPVHDQRQVGGRRQALVGQVAGRLQRGGELVGAGEARGSRRRSGCTVGSLTPRASHPRVGRRGAEGGGAGRGGRRHDGGMPFADRRPRPRRRPALLRRRLALARPRGGRAGPPAARPRIHRARRDRLLGARARGRHYVVRHGSLVAFRVGSRPLAESGLRIVGAHTDSPTFKVRPHSDVRQAGYRLVGRRAVRRRALAHLARPRADRRRAGGAARRAARRWSGCPAPRCGCRPWRSTWTGA